MNRIIVIMLILACLSACSVSRSSFRHLEETVAAQEQRIYSLEDQLRSGVSSFDQMMALNNRINALEAKLVAPSPVVEQPSQPQPQTPNIEMLYNEGRRQYETRDFSGAIRTFQQVIDLAPQHDLAANAVYWMGESYFAMGDFTAARQTFQIIQDSYPTSNKFIDAQVKIAMTWIRQDNKPQARRILEGIKRDFPNYERMNVVDQQLRLCR